MKRWVVEWIIGEMAYGDVDTGILIARCDTIPFRLDLLVRERPAGTWHVDDRHTTFETGDHVLSGHDVTVAINKEAAAVYIPNADFTLHVCGTRDRNRGADHPVDGCVREQSLLTG